jgi:hypothetical protein
MWDRNTGARQSVTQKSWLKELIMLRRDLDTTQEELFQLVLSVKSIGS